MPLPTHTSLDDLRRFVLIAEAGSVSAAARRFDISKATLSRALARLEDVAGLPLFDRRAEGLRLTQAGARLRPAAEAATRAGAEADEVLRQALGAPSGELRIAASALSAQQLLGPVLARMSVEHPAVRPVVHVTALGPDPLEEDLDVVLRLDRPPEPHLIARRIKAAPLRLYAAATAEGDLTDPATVAALGRIVIGVPGSPAEWRLTSANGDVLTLDSPPICTVGDPSVALGILSAGRGVAFLPAVYGEARVAEGHLRRALPAWEGPDVEVYVSFPPKRASVPAVRAFIDLLVQVTGR